MSAVVGRAKQADLDRRLEKRADADFVLAMAKHLSNRDRLLIEHLYREGRTAADFARLARRNVRTVQHRVKSILKRIYSPEFRYLLAHEDVLPRELRSTARRLFLEDQGLRGTARLTGLSLHAVRQHRIQIAALLEAKSHVWRLSDAAADD
ncbi:MAG: hypothetical protein AAGJ38_04300 [Planctomycetota bacterium]